MRVVEGACPWGRTALPVSDARTRMCTPLAVPWDNGTNVSPRTPGP
jgi:hypothetical protein